MCKKFPFLRDPASPEYIHAQANAETNWVRNKKDLYDPILSIRIQQLPDLGEETEDNWAEKKVKEEGGRRRRVQRIPTTSRRGP